MLTNLLAKSTLALAQLFSISVFLRLHSAGDASLIFILLGYTAWLQLFDFGVSQSIQNQFNQRKSQLKCVYVVIVSHFFILVGIGLLVALNEAFFKVVLPDSRHTPSQLTAFAIGVAMVIVCVNNSVLQRFLLIFNKGISCNLLLLMQSFIYFFLLLFYSLQPVVDIKLSVVISFLPQMIVFSPLLYRIIKKVFSRRLWMHADLRPLLADARSYWLISILATLFIGSDYYFVAHHLSPIEIEQYHIATRIFFISFAGYFAYAQHTARHFTAPKTREQQKQIVFSIIKSGSIGLSSVFSVFGVVWISNNFGLDKYFLGGLSINMSLMGSALIYFSVRVFRDVGLLVIWNFGLKSTLVKIYFSELVLGWVLFWYLSPSMSGMDIFLVMAAACGLSSVLALTKLFRILLTSEHVIR